MQSLAYRPDPETPAHRSQGFGRIGRSDRHDDAAVPGRVIALPRRRAGDTPQPSSRVLAAAARRHRTLQWQRLFSTTLHRLVALAASACAAWQQRRAQRNQRTLDDLDAHALRDLGLCRSEIGSLVAELRGAADATRLWALQAPRHGGQA